MNSNLLILHAYSRRRVEDQAETWRALELIRAEFRVVDVLCEGDGGYDDALRINWGKEGLIVLEQDVVPSLGQIDELAACPEPWCVFKYLIRYLPGQDAPYWVIHGLGCVKFSLELQQRFPARVWFHKGDWRWSNLDCRVTAPLIQAGLAPHVHGVVRHNRVADTQIS